MKTFSVNRESTGTLFVSETGKVPMAINMVAPPIAWGKHCGYPGALLATKILEFIYDDTTLVRRLAQRFKYHTIENWQPSGGSITEDEVRKIVEQLLADEKENAPMIKRMMAEQPRYETDKADRGTEWKSNPEIVPNKIEEKK